MHNLVSVRQQPRKGVRAQKSNFDYTDDLTSTSHNSLISIQIKQICVQIQAKMSTFNAKILFQNFFVIKKLWSK